MFNHELNNNNINKQLESNLWKLLIVEITQRRYYLPILSLYFLSFPNVNVSQIGLWYGAGYLAEFLFQIPTGFISDKIGHKKMLIIAKLFMIFAVLFFINAHSLLFFILGAVFTSLSFACRSGTRTAFLHETLVCLKREDDLMKINTKMAAYSSLFGAVLIILIPFTTSINLKMPLLIGLGLDIIGFISALTLVNPTVIEKTFTENSCIKKSLFQLYKESRNIGFYSVVIFTSTIIGFCIAKNRYISPYITDFGFPIIYLGLIAGATAFIQYIVAINITQFENKINIKRIFLFDIFLFSLLFLLLGFLNNFLIIVFLLVIIDGYELGRRSFIDAYLIKNIVYDKNYTATLLSIKEQITMLFNFVIVFLIGYFMDYSYKIGFYIMGGILFFILIITFSVIEK